MGFWNSISGHKKNLAEVIEDFLNASNASDAHQILEQHPELLSKEADTMLDGLSKDLQDEEVVDMIENTRNFLIICREIGIDQAFEGISDSPNELHEDLQTILEEINSFSKPQDMPRRITLIQRALPLIQSQSKPELWVFLELMLGNSLYQNPQGNREENIEQAIEHYNQALKICTYNDFPVDWAGIQDNLGNSFLSRIRGNGAENIEKAIEYYNQALKVRTPKEFPNDWAKTQEGLGNAYRDRVKGNRTGNIERAIEYYNQALKVRTQKKFPVQWAAIQNNLADIYRERIRGDRS